MAEGWHFITAVEEARQMYDTLMQYAMGPSVYFWR